MANFNPKKSMSIWHGEYMSQVQGKEAAYADREAMALVAKKTADIEKAGGGCTVSRNFGKGPAIIVLVIPTNLQPVQFFAEQDVRFTLKATLGATTSDQQIKEVVNPTKDSLQNQEVTGSDIKRSDSPESTNGSVEQDGGKSPAGSVSEGTASVPAPQPANPNPDVQPNNDGSGNKN